MVLLKIFKQISRPGKVAWLEKAFKLIAEGRIYGSNLTRVYEILAAPTFCDDKWHHAQSKRAFDLVTDEDNLLRLIINNFPGGFMYHPGVDF